MWSNIHCGLFFLFLWVPVCIGVGTDVGYQQPQSSVPYRGCLGAGAYRRQTRRQACLLLFHPFAHRRLQELTLMSRPRKIVNNRSLLQRTHPSSVVPCVSVAFAFASLRDITPQKSATDTKSPFTKYSFCICIHVVCQTFFSLHVLFGDLPLRSPYSCVVHYPSVSPSRIVAFSSHAAMPAFSPRYCTTQPVSFPFPMCFHPGVIIARSPCLRNGQLIFAGETCRSHTFPFLDACPCRSAYHY